tara:strand:- start:2011 stop:2823 length:813 start_codon:yes stop_codon:yes gene_type:complete
MKELEGMMLPTSWEELTIKQYSEYNKALSKFSEAINELDEESESTPTQILIEEIKLNFDIIKCFSGLSESEALAVDISTAREYADQLSFLSVEYKAKDLSSFSHKGVTYKFPENVGLNTKFGQYVESLQAEMAASHLDKDSVLYLSHQMAHIVEFNGEAWDGLVRDKLAEEFESLPCSIAFEFSFFLSKKYLIYNLAYLEYEKALQEKSRPFTKKVLATLVGLRRYMNWQSVVYLKNLTQLRLIVFYVQIRERYSNICRIFRRNPITIQR